MKGACFCYKGQYYDIGTKVKLKTKWNENIITTYIGYGEFEGVHKHTYYSLMAPEHYIVEIIEPVYYQEPEPDTSQRASIFTRTGSGSWQSSDAVMIGLIWYIVIMIIGSIFNARWLIWILATIIFFAWKKKL